MGEFKLRYPHVHSMGDAGEMLMGPFGRELCYWGQLLFIIFLMASHILTFTVLFNTITNHGTCTIVFGVIGLVVSCICALPRTTDKVFIMSTCFRRQYPDCYHRYYDFHRCPGSR